MRYLSSFKTSLKISRYLFRALGIMLWAMGALLTMFYLINIFNDTKSDIRQEYSNNYTDLLGFFRQTSSTIRDLQYLAERHQEQLNLNPKMNNSFFYEGPFSLHKLSESADCELFKGQTNNYFRSFNSILYYWKDNTPALQGINQVFMVGSHSMCMINFPLRASPIDTELLKKMVYENTRNYINQRAQGKESNQYWIVPDAKGDSGILYVMSPVYASGKFIALIGIERAIRLEYFSPTKDRVISIHLLNNKNNPVLSYPEENNYRSVRDVPDVSAPYFGFDDDFSDLVAKRKLLPSSFSVVYSLPLKQILNEFKFTIFNAIILNIISAIVIFIFVWIFERKIFSPAENNASRLEEHEQFNHKIVASAPVGISILRIRDGMIILSNELAHNYFRLLSHSDKQNILSIIAEKSSNIVDVVTNNHNHLQISFVNSRYQNEDVAICVLVDISARVKMERSLQNMATAAEQANQAKSMFLATVSHELRTPLYGIIGNLELLQSLTQNEETARLLKTMDNSSSLLLKIISDILDFSKIESKQLKIDVKPFNCRQVVSFVISNYLPLIAKKDLAIYCFIEPDVPKIVNNDPVRVQQVISNLLNNSIKFTTTGCITLHLYRDEYYLYFDIHDTGRGINEKMLHQLFEPFFQVSQNTESASEGTGLGLAICEKLINLMDGDISVVSQENVGSRFTVRIPLYGALNSSDGQTKYNLYKESTIRCFISIKNLYLESFIERYLSYVGLHCQLFTEVTQVSENDFIITDHDECLDNSCQFIRIYEHYFEPAKKISENNWLCSTYKLNELIKIILQLPQTKLESDDSENNALMTDHDLQLLTVLIVDDHPINRLLLTDQLKKIGFNTATAEDGCDALAFMQENHVDIILTDVNMPNMNGYQLATTVRELSRTIPIIGVTANAIAEEKQRCIDAGMNDCVSKPVSLTVLKDVLLTYVA
ncbi:two-component system sensor histidine kinase RcsC [Proteus mirabilis]|nr:MULTISPECIES: two-component system sensor histidine kinase RcsC [Proteus]EKU0761307.1 two-component system sensor histidine kinase RcsC [Proteus mirabilis]EKU5731352.1 two-component system sensor histidine kinase RcsC [Proteus mirabilis]EKX9204404.1 two-component system sensor histidine kinase RcsC [Proteus mirabilis]ELA7634128.1 two-component system sensor histidine kinase RcsC [Proteus mirabilis]ELA7681202.1 two-component system sensor histidine kinase RcsC [Proteus mirabilis]